MMTHYLISFMIHLKIINTKTSSHLNICCDNNITDIGTITSSQNKDTLCFVSSESANSTDKSGYDHSFLTSIHSRSCMVDSMRDEDVDFSGDVLNSTMLNPNENTWKEPGYEYELETSYN